MFEVNEKQLMKELVESRRRLNRNQESLLYIEPVGRCLRWLNDPEAEELFAQAAAQVSEGIRQSRNRTRKPNSYSLLTLGNYCRLTGAPDRAREAHEYAFSRLGPPEEIPWAMADYEHKIILGFLLGKDEGVVRLQRARDWGRADPWLEAMADVSRARLSGDVAPAGEAARKLAEHIRQHRIRASDGPFNLHPWDQYEITLRVKAELEGRTEDAALPAPELLRREHEVERGVPVREAHPQRKRLTREQVEDICFEEDEEPDLHTTDLSDLDLSHLDLSGANLADSDLRGADLSKTMLVETNFTGADLRGVKLAGTITQDTVFEGANLSDTDLARARLAGSDFSKANLRNANLRGANLPHTDFTGADLTGADLRGANLEGADFEEAIMDDILL